jgi:hypothetical protein
MLINGLIAKMWALFTHALKPSIADVEWLLNRLGFQMINAPDLLGNK